MRFSVIVPTYNRLPALRRCLHALLTQDYPRENYEIIVVDDGSSDGTPAYLRRLEKRNRNLRHFCMPHRGPASARNTGIRESQGEVLAFTDDDCIASKDWLAQIDACFRRTGAPAVGGSIANGVDTPLAWAHHFLNFSTWLPGLKSRYVKDCPTANVAYRRSAIRGMLFPEEYPVGEDSLFNFSFCKSGKRIFFCPDAKVSHHAWQEGDGLRELFSSQRKAALCFLYAGHKFNGKPGKFIASNRLLNLLCPRLILNSSNAFSSGFFRKFLFSLHLIALGELYYSWLLTTAKRENDCRQAHKTGAGLPTPII